MILKLLYLHYKFFIFAELKQHGFITVTKHSNTNDIKDISLGSKIIQAKDDEY